MRACPGPARDLHVALHDFIEGSDVTYDPVCHVSETSLSLGFPRFLHMRNGVTLRRSRMKVEVPSSTKSRGMLVSALSPSTRSP